MPINLPIINFACLYKTFQKLNINFKVEFIVCTKLFLFISEQLTTHYTETSVGENKNSPLEEDDI